MCGVFMKQIFYLFRTLVCCRYINWQSAEVLVLDEPSRIESAILGLLKMVCYRREHSLIRSDKH